jgi:hypothetical protein
MKYKIRVILKGEKYSTVSDSYLLTEKMPGELNMVPSFIEIEDCQFISHRGEDIIYGVKYKYFHYNINMVETYSIEECENET